MDAERRFLQMLVQSIQLLAADYHIQVAALPPFVCVADEVALTYDDCFRLLDQIVEAGLLDPSILRVLATTDAQLSDMSEQKEQKICGRPYERRPSTHSPPRRAARAAGPVVDNLHQRS